LKKRPVGLPFLVFPLFYFLLFLLFDPKPRAEIWREIEFFQEGGDSNFSLIGTGSTRGDVARALWCRKIFPERIWLIIFPNENSGCGFSVSSFLPKLLVLLFLPFFFFASSFFWAKIFWRCSSSFSFRNCSTQFYR